MTDDISELFNTRPKRSVVIYDIIQHVSHSSSVILIFLCSGLARKIVVCFAFQVVFTFLDTLTAGSNRHRLTGMFIQRIFVFVLVK